MVFATTLARHCLVALLGAALLIGAAQAADEPDKYYQVELIVFAPTHAQVNDDEVWSRSNRDPVAADDDSAMPGEAEASAQAAADGQAAAEPTLELTPLPESEFQLGTEEHRLNNSRDYKVLLHTGWRQRGVGPKEAVPFRIRYFLDGGPQEPLTPEPPTPVSADGQPAASGLQGISATAPNASGSAAPPAEDGSGAQAAVDGPRFTPSPAVQPPRPQLEGTVRLVLSRYLHLEPDLRYYTGEMIQPVQEEGADSTFYNMTLQPVVYRLEQSRRMRSGELHYFDHPAFGILARITPWEPPKEAAPQASTAAPNAAKSGG